MSVSVGAHFRMSLLKIGALFEMHRVSEARALILSLGEIPEAELSGPEFAEPCPTRSPTIARISPSCQVKIPPGPRVFPWALRQARINSAASRT